MCHGRCWCFLLVAAELLAALELTLHRTHLPNRGTAQNPCQKDANDSNVYGEKEEEKKRPALFFLCFVFVLCDSTQRFPLDPDL